MRLCFKLVYNWVWSSFFLLPQASTGKVARYQGWKVLYKHWREQKIPPVSMAGNRKKQPDADCQGTGGTLIYLAGLALGWEAALQPWPFSLPGETCWETPQIGACLPVPVFQGPRAHFYLISLLPRWSCSQSLCSGGILQGDSVMKRFPLPLFSAFVNNTLWPKSIPVLLVFPMLYVKSCCSLYHVHS